MNQLWHLHMLAANQTSDWIVGQAAAEPDWFAALFQIDVGKLAVLLIFGTGIIGAIGYTITSAIRAYAGAPDESESLNARIAALEQRVQQLEQKR